MFATYIKLALSNVVLPAPLAPMSSVRVPGCRLTLMSRTTGDAPGCGRPSGGAQACLSRLRDNKVV